MNRWKPSKSAARKFAQMMDDIDRFCAEHGITASRSSDSYYFDIRGQRYRVSNHTVQKSNRTMIELGRVPYHPNGEDDDTVYITAGKTRIIEIYNNLAAGKTLDKRGNVI